jgi:hypothetical protein
VLDNLITLLDKKTQAATTPPAPEKPDPNECCGSGCVPCIYDYYFDRLAKWEDEYGKRDE